MSNNSRLAEIFKLIGQKWTIAIFYSLADNPCTFNELRKIRMPSINPTLLSNRLKKMIKLKIVSKRKIAGIVKYSLTDKGKKLILYLQNLKKWAIKSELKLPSNCSQRD